VYRGEECFLRRLRSAAKQSLIIPRSLKQIAFRRSSFAMTQGKESYMSASKVWALLEGGRAFKVLFRLLRKVTKTYLFSSLLPLREKGLIVHSWETLILNLLTLQIVKLTSKISIRFKIGSSGKEGKQEICHRRSLGGHSSQWDPSPPIF